MKIIRFKKYGVLFSRLTIGVFSFSITNFAVAAEYCVGTALELEDALDEAEINGEDDIIKIRQGPPYIGNFEYIASATETNSLTILGGYKPKPPHCKKRVVDPTNTVLDGAGGFGIVLLLTVLGIIRWRTN